MNDWIDCAFGSEVIIFWSFYPTDFHISQSLHRVVDGFIRDNLSPFLFWHIKWMSMNWHQTTLVALWISLLIPNIEIAKHLSLNIFSLWCNCGGPNSILKGVSTQPVGRNGGPNRTLSRFGLCFDFSQWALLFSLFSLHIHVSMRHWAF